jgi:hypothetical protein
MSKVIEMSVCIYPGKGTFDVLFQDPETGTEVVLSGKQNLNKEQIEFLASEIPPCVWTRALLNYDVDG